MLFDQWQSKEHIEKLSQVLRSYVDELRDKVADIFLRWKRRNVGSDRYCLLHSCLEGQHGGVAVTELERDAVRRNNAEEVLRVALIDDPELYEKDFEADTREL